MENREAEMGKSKKKILIILKSFYFLKNFIKNYFVWMNFLNQK